MPDLPAFPRDELHAHPIADYKGALVWDGAGGQPARPAGFRSVEFVQGPDPAPVAVNGDTWTPSA